MKRTELNNELLTRVNGGTNIDDILNPTPYDPTLPLFDNDNVAPAPGSVVPDIDTIREIMKKVVNDYGTGYEF